MQIENMTCREITAEINKLTAKPMSPKQFARYGKLTEAQAVSFDQEMHEFRMERPDLLIVRVAQYLHAISPSPIKLIQAMQETA